MALSDQYVGGLTPRSAVDGTRYIFTSTVRHCGQMERTGWAHADNGPMQEIPPMLPIPQHIEMSYLPDSPDALVSC